MREWRRQLVLASLAIVTLVASSAACSKSSSDVEPAVVSTPAPPIPSASGLFACHAGKSCAAIPAVLHTLAFGMDKAAIAAVFSPVRVTDHVDELTIVIGVRHFTFGLSPDGKLDTIDEQVDGDALPALTAELGAPLVVTSGSTTMRAWLSPTARLKLWMLDDRVRIEPYTPVADLVGASGFVARPLLGKTREQNDAAYPDLDALDHDGQTDGPALLGIETMTTHLRLATRYDAAGALASYSLVLPFGDGPAGRELRTELLVAIDAVLGAPFAATRTGATLRYDFRGANNTVIELRADDTAIAWTLEVRAK